MASLHTNFTKFQVLLLDIEGTTTSISFVKDVLFPYARQNLHTFLERTWDKPDTQIDVSELNSNAGGNENWDVAETEIEILRLMDADVKNTALKRIQGRIWKSGYESKELVGHVYDDVPPALERWSGRIFIYSSGSVQAQKLLFANTIYGNLLKHIEGHFDTMVGAKNDAASYGRIAEIIQTNPSNILFLTDVVAEARAATESGLNSHLVVRPGNTPLSQEDQVNFQIISTFSTLFEIQ